MPAENFRVPSPEEFITAFGCDHSFDEDTATELLSFEDSKARHLTLAFGVVDGSFSVSVKSDGDQLVFIYLNNLTELTISDREDAIHANFFQFEEEMALKISIWPLIKIESNSH